jgi:hypothetical protein
VTKQFTIRCYGAMDFRVAARTAKAAVTRLNRMFDKDNPVDPISGRQISTGLLALGFYVLLPKDTKEFKHGDPDV